MRRDCAKLPSPLKQEDFASKMEYTKEPIFFWRQITQLMLTVAEPQTLLSLVARSCAEIFQADSCLIIAGVDSTAKLQASVCTANSSLTISAGQATRLIAHPLLKEVLAAIEPVAIADFSVANQDEQQELLQSIFPARASLGITIRIADRVNGVILIFQSEPRQWSVSEQELLKSIAEPVAIAISFAQQQQQAATTSRHQVLLTQLSAQITQASKSANVEEIYQLALNCLVSALEVDRGLILNLKYADPLYKRTYPRFLPQVKATVSCQWVTTSTSVNQITNLPYHYSFSLSDCPISRQAFLTSPQPLAIAISSELEQQVDSLLYNPEITPSILFIPFLGNSSGDSNQPTVLGFAVLQQTYPRIWQQDEIELAKLICHQAATAIIHQQTLGQVNSIVKERTEQLQRSLEIQAKLSEKMRQYIHELRELNKLKDEFIANMSHEFRTPLASMKLAIEMLRQYKSSPDRQAKYLSILEEEWHRENNLVQDLLTWQKLKSNKFTTHPQKVALKSLVQELCDRFQAKWSQDSKKKLTLALDDRSVSTDDLTIYTDLESLQNILNELLTNAGKFSADDTTVSFQVVQKLTRTEKQIIFTITNLSYGITPEEQTYIFEPFRRGKWATDKEIRGTGLGLALVKSFVEHLNGTIELKITPSQNSQIFLTSFTVTLPQLDK
ncbi:sensor histidine kinase [Oscillatoria salina]|uniref:sensor histidine kinase n=1 Tax=Oscillatoria salina TaxID=331517 RepID=UPI0013BD54AE|nr:GAF domain-containing protein [Oscillatoria salina]MBZ8181075.1 GAF domain-containing protein [Oscillatoria salina IIICB1]NET91308.1 GAF domain-containing protein [Kamptonema sp. SIO1D9]